jgi:hypothetical protein
MPLSSEAIERVLGPVDNPTKAQIAGTGATEGELVEALAWVQADDVLVDEGRRLPTGKVAELVDILEPPPGDHAA